MGSDPVREPKHFELLALLQFIERNIEDPHVIGVIPGDIESVRRFWREYCHGLRYHECKNIVINQFRYVMKKRRPEEVQYDEIQERRMLEEYRREYFRERYGTYRVSELFDMYPDIAEEDVDVFLDYVRDTHRCWDAAVLTPAEIGVIVSNIELEMRGLAMLFVPARSVQELSDYLYNQIVVSDTRDVYILYCYTGDSNWPRGYPLMASRRVIFTSRGAKRYALVY